MRNIIKVAAVLMCLSLPALAQMDDVDFTQTIALSTAKTNTPFVARGEIASIRLYIGTAAASQTGTVTVASGGVTILSASSTNDNTWYPMVQAHSTAGVALTYTTALTETNRVFIPIPVADTITSSILQGSASGTNVWNLQIKFKK